jgi:hypothetical protein
MKIAHLSLALVVVGCASTPAEKPDETSEETVELAHKPPPPESVEPNAAPLASEQPPARFDEVAERYEFLCPAPHFELEEPHEVKVGAATFRVEGTRIVRVGEATKTLRIGVVAAPKDKTDDTRQNLKRAQKWFAKSGVDAVLVPGDVAEDEDLQNVMKMLAEVFPEPLLLHSGNIEWTGAFTAAFEAVRKDHANVFNLNWSPHVDFGGVHVLALAGYHNKKFSRSGACRYQDDDLAAVEALAQDIRAKGEQVVLTSHGPPHNAGKRGLDFAHEGAGNVGDPDITERLLKGADVRFGVFSHILEAGGRAVSGPDGSKSLAQLKKRKKSAQGGPSDHLYVNAGSASSFPWTMLDGSRSEGIAAIFTLDGDQARVAFKRLR